MHSGIVVWLIIFAVSTIVFFGVAAVVTVRGLSDLRALLDSAETENVSEEIE